MKSLPLRGYQTEALDAIKAGFERGLQREAVVLPTGLGKTVIFANLAEREVAKGGRVLILVHRDELVNQAVEKLASVAPGWRVGVVKAERDEVDAPIVVASVQTLARQYRRFAVRDDEVGRVTLIIVDECHHAAADSYLAILTDFGCFPGRPPSDRTVPTSTRCVGFTATMTRADARGLGDVFEEIVYTKDILYGIERGFLSDVKGKRITVEGLDLREVAITHGDYREGKLGDAMVTSGAGEVIAAAYVEHASDRQGILFTPTVEAAYEWAMDLNSAGIPTEVIEGRTPREDRLLIYKKFREGEVQVLSNCMVLTEGFDMPQASCAVVARPTSLPGLYTQMVGRVLRPFPGKKDALVLDVVGVASRLELATLTDLTTTTVREVKEDETLAEAAAREESERQRHIVNRVGEVGELHATHVDLFKTSRSVWLKTEKGLWFIPTREFVFFLWPLPNDMYAVGRVPAKGRGRVEKLVDLTNLEYGMAWAEAEAEADDKSVSSKKSSWRQGSRKPSEAQMGMALLMGIDVSDEPSRGELSDRISIKVASRLLDRYVK